MAAIAFGRSRRHLNCKGRAYISSAVMEANMRMLTVPLALALTLALIPASQADYKREGKRKAYRSEQHDREYRGRSTTVDRRGLCQRDNGRPLESLNLNHECDRQEFWARFNDRGDNRN
ncbi:MAG: hypothetical protein R3D67_18005 [Hyphomicrobiaceae bacterium]